MAITAVAASATAFTYILLFVAWFWFVAIITGESKRYAFAMSSLSSWWLSIASMFYLGMYTVQGDAFLFGPAHWTADYLLVMFAVFLSLDLFIGFFTYFEHMGFLEAWLHHPAYLGIICIVLFTGVQNIFFVACLSEIPTLLRAVGTIVPDARSDLLFGLTFVLTRIVFHAWLVFVKLLPVLHFGVTWVGLMTLSLHIYWFALWLKSMHKRTGQRFPLLSILNTVLEQKNRSIARPATKVD